MMTLHDDRADNIDKENCRAISEDDILTLKHGVDIKSGKKY